MMIYDEDDGDFVTYCNQWRRGVPCLFWTHCETVFSRYLQLNKELIAILRAGRYAAGLHIMWKAGPCFIYERSC